MSAEEKKKLRALLKEKRPSSFERELLSRKIEERLFSLEEFKNASTVFAFFSDESEPDTKELFKKALSKKKTVALPRSNADNSLSFHCIKSEDDLEPGKFKGILEPKSTLPTALNSESALCLVPAVAFGKNGSRLGRGKGFYDRFLSSFRGFSVGLCFESRLFEELPEDEFDRRVSAIITENQTIYIKDAEER